MGYKLTIYLAAMANGLLYGQATTLDSKQCSVCTWTDPDIHKLFPSEWKPGDALPKPTRDQVLRAATSIAQTEWIPSAANTSKDVSDEYGFKACQSWVGVPYMNGGRDASPLFCKYLSRGRLVLSLPITGSGHGYATGMDCSAFVTYCWGLRGYHHKFNVKGILDELENKDSPYFHKVAYSDLKPGDALISNTHIVLYAGHAPNNSGLVICEAPRASTLVNCSAAPLVRFAGWTEVRYRPIIDSETPNPPFISPKLKRKEGRPKQTKLLPPAVPIQQQSNRHSSRSPDTTLKVQTVARPADPVFAVDASPNVDFGISELFHSKEQSVLISNLSDTPLSVTIAAKGDGFSVAGPGTVTVGAKAKAPILIVFKSTTVGEAVGTLTIQDQSGGQIEQRVLKGTVIKRCATFRAGPSLPFGVVSSTTAGVEQTTAIRNCGTVDLTVEAVTLESGREGFTLDVAAPAKVAPDNEVPVRVHFRALRYGSFRDTVIANTDSGGPITMALQATGTEPCLSVKEHPSFSLGEVRSQIGGRGFSLTVDACGGESVGGVRAHISTWSGDGTFRLANMPSVVSPNASSHIEITFEPHSTELARGRLQLDGDMALSQTVDLSGKGLVCVEVGQSALQFPVRRLDSRAYSRDLRLRNCGSIPIPVSSLSIASDRNEFRLVHRKADASVIEPGSEVALTLSYQPFDKGARHGALLVQNADPEHSTIRLVGTAIARHWWNVFGFRL